MNFFSPFGPERSLNCTIHVSVHKYTQCITIIQNDPWTYPLEFLFFKVHAEMNSGILGKADAKINYGMHDRLSEN